MQRLPETQIVNGDISGEDRMFAGSKDHYFAVGESALHCIEASMFAAGIKTFESILDLPCGHGRVLRHLQSAFPRAQLTACDIDRGGVDFCAATFGATPVYGHNSPHEIRLQGNYDLIWVGSLLTHLNSNNCAVFLEFFCASLRPRGLLVFTVHGRAVEERLREGASDYGLDPTGITQALKEYASDGFGYANYPVTTPVVGEDYGISLASPCWVYGQMEKLPDMQLLNYTEKGWDNHQDAVAFLRVG
jgi:SAM-dependent methyltransferase